MSTNASFQWIPQAGIIAQEVWYGKLTDVGSTLPPGAGWSQGANLYAATANNATLFNLDENTQYQFLVKSHCSTGDSGWSVLGSYKLVCPTIGVVSHTTSIDVTLSVLNAAELSKLVSNLTLTIQEVSSGNVKGIINFSGPSIISTITHNFGSLSASTNYLISLSYAFIPGGPATLCSTKATSTSISPTCSTITFGLSNITTVGFTVTPSGLVGGDTYDISTDGGATFIPGSQPTYTFVTLTPGTTYSVVVRRNCGNGTSSLTTPQSVTLPVSRLLNVGYGLNNFDVCSTTNTVFIDSTFPNIQTGATVFTDFGLSQLLLGQNFIGNTGGIIFVIDPSTGIVGANTNTGC